MNSPDRVAGHIVANAGVADRLLEESEAGPLVAGPALADHDAAHRHAAWADDPAVVLLDLDDTRAPGEQVSDVEADRPELVNPASLGDQREVADDPLVGGERPRVHQRQAELLAAHERSLPHVDALGGLVLRADPREGKGLAVPDADRERDGITHDAFAAAEMSLVHEPDQAALPPDAASEVEPGRAETEHDDERCPEQAASDHEDQPDGTLRSERHRALRTRSAQLAGGTATAWRTSSKADAAVAPRMPSSTSTISRWVRTAGATACTSSGSTKSRPARNAHA